MRYSLSSRFQGVLLGSIIPEALDISNPSREETLSDWLKISVSITERLIESGKLNSSNGEQIYSRLDGWANLKNTASSSHTALATLPVALFVHERPSLLKEKLQQAAAIWQHPEEPIEDVFIWGYALALALREKLHTTQFIEQILEVFRGADTPLVGQLEEINVYLRRDASLEEVVDWASRSDRPERTAMALAFYCFACTPEDFRLSVARAKASDFLPRTTAALTGALAGAYNSFIGIPVGWRLLAQKHPLGMEVNKRAKLLFALWSGVYQPSQVILAPGVAISSPQIIQPRSSLKIISQTE